MREPVITDEIIDAAERAWGAYNGVMTIDPVTNALNTTMGKARAKEVARAVIDAYLKSL